MRWLRRLRPDRGSRTIPIAEPMEPRLLYSADVTAGLMLATSTADAAPEVRTLTTSGEYTRAATATSAATAASAYESAALNFEANQGQAPAGVDFVAQGSGYGIALSGGNAQLTLADGQGVQAVSLTLQGAHASAAQGEDLQAARSNYILGSDASQWQTGIANYAAVRYANVYDGVDVRYYGTQRQLEYDFIVAAGADAGAIRLQFQGAASVTVDGDGNLVLQVAGSDSTVRFQAPVAYQRGADGQLQAVASRYEVHADGTVGFVLGEYDHARELVIDPVLDYATYFGDSGNETAYAVTTDAAGNVYVTGRTNAVASSTGPLAPVIGVGGGAGDIFVAKFNADLSQLIWSTRIGGSADEQGNAIAVDANGNVAVTGWTRSSNFPTQNASQASINGSQDAVILKLDSSGALLFSTYLGGTGATDSANAVAFDGAGNLYAAGQESDTGALSAPLQAIFGSSDNAFVNKYDASGTLTWSQLLGGNATDLATGIAVDGSGNAYVVGNTQSSNMSTAGGQQTSLSGTIDGFLVRLDAGGSTTYSTYVGGTDADTATGVAIDGTGKAYVVGVTRARASVVFTTTPGAFMTSSPASANNKDTGYLRIYDTTQTGAASLVYSSYLGGSGSDLPAGVAYANGRVVVVGLAGSTDFPITADALQATNPGAALFIAILDPAGAGAADLQYGTYYGASMTAGGVAVHGNTAYFAGGSTASGYSTGSVYQPVKSGGADAIVVALGNIVNTAPVLAGIVQPPAIVEDSGAGSGFMVGSLLAGQVTDPDSAAVQGIAIIASDDSNGSWHYSLDNGSTWTAVGATSAASALLLAADLQTRLRFVPAADYSGTATLTVRAWDRTSGTAGTRASIAGTGGTTAYSSASFPVNQQVTPVNDAPVRTGGTVADLTVAEDSGSTSLGLGGLAYGPGGGSDESSQVLTYTVTSLPPSALGLVTLADGTAVAAGTYTLAQFQGMRFQTAADAVGTGTFAFTVNDNGGGTDTLAQSLQITVTPVNDAPVRTAGSVADLTVAEDSGGTSLGLSGLSYGQGGGSDESGQVLTYAVTAVPPSTLGNVTLADGTVVTTGTYTLAQIQGMKFQTAADANGSGTFSFTVRDNGGGTDTLAQSLQITVTPVNDAPVRTAGSVADLTVAEDSGSTSLGLGGLGYGAGGGSDEAAQVLTYTVTAVPPSTLGSVTLADGTVVTTGTYTLAQIQGMKFQTAANAYGSGTFAFTVNDNGGGTDTLTQSLLITVTPVNDTPTTSNVVLPSMQEDGAPVTITTSQLLANAGDVDGDALSIANLVASSGTLVANGNGTWTFTPAANANGPVGFTYDISDGTVAIAATASLQVDAVNDPPTTSSVTLPTMLEDGGTVTITLAQLLANAGDVDGDALSVANLSAGTGTLVDNGNGTWSFTPGANANGTVTFTYDVTDGTATTAGSASLQVVAVNDAPTTSAVTLPGMAEDGGSITITTAQLLANAADIDGDALSVVNLSTGSGTLVDNGNGSWTFTPAADFNGTVNFSYGITDGTATTAGAAGLQVSPVNDAPATANVVLPAMLEDGGTVTITAAQLLSNAADVDGDALTLANVGASSGTLVANGNGTWSFTPAANFNGPVTFTYDVTDGTATTAGTASLQVAAVNDAPATAPVTLPGMAEDGGSVTITSAQLLANATDIEGDALSVVGLAASSGSLVDNGDGTWTFTPGRDFNGVVSFTYTVGDGGAGTQGAASLAIAPVNDAPQITSDGGQPAATVIMAENTAAVTTVTANDVDSPARQVVFSIAGGADAAQFTIDPATGALAFVRTPDFELPTDTDRDNVYEVVVQASDGSAASQQLLSVRVADVDEIAPPTLPTAPAPAAAPPAAAPLPPALVPAPAAAAAPVVAAPATDTRGNRTAESLQEALGPAMQTAIAAFNANEVSFATSPARIVLAADTSHVFRTVVFDRGGLELISAQNDDMLFARVGIDSRTEAVRLDDFQRTLRSSAFAGQLDRLREAVREDLDLDRTVNISVVSVSLGLSVAYVLWLIRGGVLVGSYLSALPAWRMLDPLPVLSRVDEEEDEEEPLEGGRRDGRDTLRGFG